MTLHEILLAVRDPSLRDEALRAFEGEPRARLEAMVRRAHDLDDVAREVVLTHARDCVLSSANRYRGVNGEGSAWAWVQRIVANRCNDLRDTRRRAQRYAQQEEARADAARGARVQEEDDFALTREVYAAIRRLVEAPPAGVRVASEWNEYVELAVAHRWDPKDTREELVARGMIAAGETDPTAFRHARDLLYQRRLRGRQRLAELLAQLVALGRLDDEGASRVAAIHGAPWPPKARPTRVH